MIQLFLRVQSVFSFFFTPWRFRLLVIICVIVTLVQWPGRTAEQGLSGEVVLPELSTSLQPMPAEHHGSGNDFSAPSVEYQIRSGDNLSGIFSRLAISQQTMYQILESDVNLLALDTLTPGDTLRFWLDEDYQLNKLEVEFNLARHVVFNRVDSVNFDSVEVIQLGEWKPQVIKGNVKGSFYVAARQAGLTPNEIDQIASLFKEKIKFSRDLRAGDSFAVLRNQQYIDGVKNHHSELLAILINNQKIPLSAFLNADGNYYDKEGNSLSRAFLRYPTKRKYRITSPFNPRRKHPVTKRISPHNGTDFATPKGTPVIATGDGVVRMVKNHPYAGKYIVLDHGGSYRTRFLHLSKILVSKGQKVNRGKVIALSGNTGRSTGPHLHFEFHVNGRAVNAMTTWIPTESSVPKKDRKAFEKLVAKRMALMENGTGLLAEEPPAQPDQAKKV